MKICQTCKQQYKKNNDRFCSGKCRKGVTGPKQFYLTASNEDINERLLINFNKYFTQKDSNECWLWTGHLNKDGYGTFQWIKRSIKAHQASYKLFVGDIPENKFVLHSCDRRNCVNFRHLSLGTQKENMQQCKNRGRNKFPFWGETHPDAVLNDEKVKQIKLDLLKNQYSENQLAKKYNCSRGAICGIKRNKNWKHIIL